MNIQTDREQMIFKSEYDGKVSYSVGLSKKNQNNEWENGYMTVRFKKGVILENKTKIKIKNAWISFNNHDKKTYPFIFINEFETVGAEKAETKVDNMSVFEEFGAEHQDLEDLLPF